MRYYTDIELALIKQLQENAAGLHPKMAEINRCEHFEKHLAEIGDDYLDRELGRCPLDIFED